MLYKSLFLCILRLDWVESSFPSREGQFYPAYFFCRAIGIIGYIYNRKIINASRYHLRLFRAYHRAVLPSSGSIAVVNPLLVAIDLNCNARSI